MAQLEFFATIAAESHRNSLGFNPARLPPALRQQLKHSMLSTSNGENWLTHNRIYHGDARDLLPCIEPISVALSFWSPPYFVGKEYETHLTFDSWMQLMATTIRLHFSVLKPGGFLAINIADILCFSDPAMPKVQVDAVSRKVSPVTLDDVLEAHRAHPEMNRYQLAKLLGCSEQTIDRRLNGNNIRGGKYKVQTRVKIVGGLIEEWGTQAGLYLYDRRAWVKDPAWENSRWHSLSYRAIDEFEYIYIFWKPGITKYNRGRLSDKEWAEWGSRGVWHIPSVRANDDHPAKFPVELASRVVRLFSEVKELVIDPFMGSGTTAIAARMADRDFIGIDSEKKYVQLAQRNLADQSILHAD